MTDITKVVAGYELILAGLGLDTTDPHLRDTSNRAAKAMVRELCRGLIDEPPKLTTFPALREEMVVMRDIPVLSLCAHHLLPFVGTATVGYIPGKGEILGASKLSRVVDHYARRPQVQEDLTSAIADELARLMVDTDTDKGGVGVIIHARHMCMELRGVRHRGLMTTSALRGIFLQGARQEFLEFANPGTPT